MLPARRQQCALAAGQQLHHLGRKRSHIIVSAWKWLDRDAMVLMPSMAFFRIAAVDTFLNVLFDIDSGSDAYQSHDDTHGRPSPTSMRSAP